MNNKLIRNFFLINFFYFLLPFALAAQSNLVANPSFEDTLNCPDNWAQIDRVPPWFKPTDASTSLFNECNTSFLGVPKNIFGFQPARTGSGYISLALYGRIPQQTETYRQYIETELIDSLTAEKKYLIEFYVNFAPDRSECALNNIGAYISHLPIMNLASISVFNVIPQVVNSSTKALTDTIEWTKISGEYIAVGGEKYLTLGNFHTNENSDTVFIKTISGSSRCMAYYYLDDVSVQELKVSINTPLEIPNIFTPNNDNINDVFQINNLPEGSSVFIYNRWGVKVFDASTPLSMTDWDGRTTSGLPCPEGVYYYYQVTLPDGTNQKGFVQLEQ